jgi:hypothetical protein
MRLAAAAELAYASPAISISNGSEFCFGLKSVFLPKFIIEEDFFY